MDGGSDERKDIMKLEEEGMSDEGGNGNMVKTIW